MYRYTISNCPSPHHLPPQHNVLSITLLHPPTYPSHPLLSHPPTLPPHPLHLTCTDTPLATAHHLITSPNTMSSPSHCSTLPLTPHILSCHTPHTLSCHTSSHPPNPTPSPSPHTTPSNSPAQENASDQTSLQHQQPCTPEIVQPSRLRSQDSSKY